MREKAVLVPGYWAGSAGCGDGGKFREAAIKCVIEFPAVCRGFFFYSILGRYPVQLGVWYGGAGTDGVH